MAGRGGMSYLQIKISETATATINPRGDLRKRPNYHPSAPNDYSEKRYVSHDFRVIGARWGTTSMIYRRSGIEKILHFIKSHKIFLPYDLDLIHPEGIRLFTLVEDVISNVPDAPSDNGGPNYKSNQHKNLSFVNLR